MVLLDLVVLQVVEVQPDLLDLLDNLALLTFVALEMSARVAVPSVPIIVWTPMTATSVPAGRVMKWDLPWCDPVLVTHPQSVIRFVIS